jgi:biopolymer transport protein ExbD
MELSSRIPLTWTPSHANAARAAKRRPTTKPRFDLYAMVSVFVALFFLLISQQPSHVDLPRFVADLPHAFKATPQPGALREDAITVSVTRDGQVFFRNEEIDPAQLSARIWESIRGGAPIKVYLSADARARTGDVNAVIEQIQRAGIKDVVILANAPNR